MCNHEGVDFPELVLPLGRLLVHWGCLVRVTSDLSSWVERLRAPRDRRPESAIVLVFAIPVILSSLVSHGITSDVEAQVKGSVGNACSSVSSRLGDPWRVFYLAMQMGSRFRRPLCEASRALVGHARAYRDILNDALAASLVIRHARRFRIILVRVP
ncbi:hypothetical protein CDL15_Pgr026171 [Punica granatum]|nr:hypothetical protein CDL15_Pgr026171 [Punica granatum]